MLREKLRESLLKIHLLPIALFFRNLYFYYLADHPLQISWAITGLCNSKCVFCEAHEQLNRNKDIPTNRVFSLIDEIHDVGIDSLLLVGGEPFLRKDIFSILEHIGNKKLKVQIITNALLIPNLKSEDIDVIKRNVSKISFSLDSTDAEQYDIIRGIPGAFDKVSESLKLLAGSAPKLNLTAVVYAGNACEIPKLVGLGSELGMSFVHFQFISPATIFENTEVKKDKLQLLPKNDSEISLIEKYIYEGIEVSKKYRIETNLKHLKLFARPYFESHVEDMKKKEFFMDKEVKHHRCLSVFTNNFIDYDGSFKLCPFLPPLGNVREDGLKNLLSKGRKLKYQFKRGNIPLKFCRNCFCTTDVNLEFSAFLSPIRNMNLICDLL